MTDATTHITQPRRVERVVAGQATSDGAGVKLTRVLTQDLQLRLDPFLMLDNFASDDPDDYGAGFPDHPHRGFETVTYMIAGRMRHRDSAGNEGLLQNGGVQWMTTGRGLVHSEMPEQEEGVMEGFQLWLNLPGKDKLCEPWYRDIQSPEVPELTTAGGVKVRVIAGESHGTAGAVGGQHPIGVQGIVAVRVAHLQGHAVLQRLDTDHFGLPAHVDQRIALDSLVQKGLGVLLLQVVHGPVLVMRPVGHMKVKDLLASVAGTTRTIGQGMV